MEKALSDEELALPPETPEEMLKAQIQAQEDDDSFDDFINEVREIPRNLPQITEGIKNKTQEHLGKHIGKIANSGQEALSKAHSHISDHIGQYVGAVGSTIVSFTLLLIPLALVIFALERIRAIFSLQKVLLLANMYIAAYCFTLLGAWFIIGYEPMKSLKQSSDANFIFLQLLQALAYSVYLLLQMLAACLACRKGTDIYVRASSGVQLFVALCVGLHYFVAVFQRAMRDQPPKITYMAYLTYFISFTILCLLAQVRKTKAEALRTGAINGKQN
eukprot:SM000465S16653  [mRNA]  locus=s465:6613:8513:- [translate_table: standard]